MLILDRMDIPRNKLKKKTKMLNKSHSIFLSEFIEEKLKQLLKTMYVYTVYILMIVK